MITHLVLFRPHDSLGRGGREAILQSLAEVVRQCPAIRTCRVGRRVRHGLPGYEQAMAMDYAFALTLEFDDVAGLREYLTHPAHEQLGGFFSSAGTESLAYDYEFMDLAAAGRVL